jgi:hypothetical protein
LDLALEALDWDLAKLQQDLEDLKLAEQALELDQVALVVLVSV